MSPNKTIRSCLAFSLFAIFACYFYSITFFTHSHVINGVTIVHSHPSQNKNHSSDNDGHSTKQIELISHLSHYLTSGKILPPVFERFVQSCDPVYAIYHPAHILSDKTDFLSLRGPPFA